MVTCYLCESKIEQHNNSIEHVIPNFIGGRLKSKELLCRLCNSDTGYTIDAELFKLGNYYAIKFQIKRDRGEIHSMDIREKETGKLVRYNADGSHYYVHKPFEKTTTGIVYHSIAVLQQHIKSLKKSINDKIEIEIVETKVQKEWELDVSRSMVLRAICKILVNYHLFTGGRQSEVKTVIDYINQGFDNKVVTPFDFGLSSFFHSSNPYHIIIIKGINKKKVIIGYFELFGIHGYAVIINGRYIGEDFTKEYTYDPVSGIEIEFSYKVDFPLDDIWNIIINNNRIFHETSPLGFNHSL